MIWEYDLGVCDYECAGSLLIECIPWQGARWGKVQLRGAGYIYSLVVAFLVLLVVASSDRYIVSSIRRLQPPKPSRSYIKYRYAHGL